MQPSLARRRRAWLAFRQAHPGADPGRDATCWTGEPNAYDPLCPPARRDLGAPEIQHCGYQNADRRRCWMAIMAGYGVGSPASALAPGQCVTHYDPEPHQHCAPPPGAPGHGYSAGAYPPHYMAKKNLWELEQYAQSTRAALEGEPHHLPGWAKHKLSQARTHVGDVAHFIQYHQQHQGTHAMTGFSAGYATDGGGGSPYGYPQTYEAFGVFSPLRRNRARQIAAQTDAAKMPYGPYGGQTVPAYGYSAGRARGRVSVVDVPFPDNSGYLPAPPYMDEGAEFVGRFPDGSTRMLLCICGYCCTVGDGSCKGLLKHCIKRKETGAGQMGGMAGFRYAGYGGTTGAAAKSASAVRRYNLLARSRRAAGYGVGMESPGVRPRLNQNWPEGHQVYGYPWTPASGGVFYGTQNPVRAAERQRQHPSGWQHGFAVGGEHEGMSVGGGGGGCGCG